MTGRDRGYAQFFRWDREGYRLESEYRVSHLWDSRWAFPHRLARVKEEEQLDTEGVRTFSVEFSDIGLDAITPASGLVLPTEGVWYPGSTGIWSYVSDDWYIASLDVDMPGTPPQARIPPFIEGDQSLWFVHLDGSGKWSVAHVDGPPDAYTGDAELRLQRAVLGVQDGWALVESYLTDLPHRDDPTTERELWRLDGGVALERRVPRELPPGTSVTVAGPRPGPALASFAMPTYIPPDSDLPVVYTRTPDGWGDAPELIGANVLFAGDRWRWVGAEVARQEWAFGFGGGMHDGHWGFLVWVFRRDEDRWHCLGSIDPAENPGRAGRPMLASVTFPRIALQDDTVLLYFIASDYSDDAEAQAEEFLYAFER